MWGGKNLTELLHLVVFLTGLQVAMTAESFFADHVVVEITFNLDLKLMTAKGTMMLVFDKIKMLVVPGETPILDVFFCTFHRRPRFRIDW